MCPALILAANRNERVIGRTRILIVSTITKKGLSHQGAPAGKRCAVKDTGLWVAPERIRDNHRGKPKDNVKIKWEENLNI
jgi:hypothetical protein